MNMETEDIVPQEEQRDEENTKEDQASNVYQHIKEAKDSMFDAQTLDAATEVISSLQTYQMWVNVSAVYSFVCPQRCCENVIHFLF